MLTCGHPCCEVIREDCGDIQQVQGVVVLFARGKGRNGKNAFVKLAQSVIEVYLTMRGQVRENEPRISSIAKVDVQRLILSAEPRDITICRLNSKSRY